VARKATQKALRQHHAATSTDPNSGFRLPVFLPWAMVASVAVRPLGSGWSMTPKPGAVRLHRQLSYAPS
jgi:hypothetical protein